MQHLFAHAAVGFSIGILSCTFGEGHALIGLVAVPAVIFAGLFLDPRRPLVLPVAVALGRLCWLLPLVPLAAGPGDLDSLVAGWVVGPAIAYWLLLLALYGVVAYLGYGCGRAARRRARAVAAASSVAITGLSRPRSSAAAALPL